MTKELDLLNELGINNLRILGASEGSGSFRINKSFQPELGNIKPVYGTLRPARTWNPILINFKHLWQLIQDAYHTENIWDKFRIWFMPTGWRPEDVKLKFPIYIIQNPTDYKKYHTNCIDFWRAYII